jgi:hypothetical protein
MKYLIVIENKDGERGFLSLHKRHLVIASKPTLETLLFDSEEKANDFLTNTAAYKETRFPYEVVPADAPEVQADLAKLKEPVYGLKVYQKGYHKGYIHYHVIGQYYYMRPGIIGTCCWRLTEVEAARKTLAEKFPQYALTVTELNAPTQ